MRIKKDDSIVVIAGKDRGKKGKVLQVLHDRGKIVVEGVNKTYKHTKPRRGKEKGERIEYNAPISHSNVMILCSKCNKPVRVGIKLQSEKKQRICKKCKNLI